MGCNREKVSVQVALKVFVLNWPVIGLLGRLLNTRTLN